MPVKIVGQGGVPERGWNVKKDQAPPRFGTWKEYWEKNSGGPWPAICSLAGCNNPATAILVVEHASVPGAYIAPVCSFCSKRSGAVALKPNVALVSVR